MSAAIDPFITLLSKAVDVKAFIFATFRRIYHSSWRVAAGVTVQFYDTAINLADERAFIWRQPWSIGKTMYLLTRYSVFIDSVLILWYQFYPGNTIKSCQTLYIVASWFMTSGIILCETILILRTYAIWGKNKLVLAYMASVQTVAIILSVYFMHESIKSTTFISLVSPSIITCLPVLGNNRMLIVYCCIMVAESNVLFLSLYRGFTQWKRDSTPLVRVLYRDAISLANAVIVSELFNSPFYYILSLMQRVFHSILTSHLIMNVRKAAIGREHQLERFVNSSFSATRVKYMENLSFSSGISPTDRTYEIELRCTLFDSNLLLRAFTMGTNKDKYREPWPIWPIPSCNQTSIRVQLTKTHYLMSRTSRTNPPIGDKVLKHGFRDMQLARERLLMSNRDASFCKTKSNERGIDGTRSDDARYCLPGARRMSKQFTYMLASRLRRTNGVLIEEADETHNFLQLKKKRVQASRTLRWLQLFIKRSVNFPTPYPRIVMSAVIDQWATLFSNAVDVRFSFVSAVAVQFYDVAINLADESIFIWAQSWSAGKILYLLTRYSAFIDLVTILWYQFHTGQSPEACHTLYAVSCWFMTGGIILSEVILAIRTYAIWDKNRFILAYLSSVLMAAIILSIFFLNQSIKATTFIQSVSPTVITCLPILGNNRMFAVYCCIMVAESNVLILSLYRGFSQWRRDSTPLVHTLYRDGVMYFAVLFSISLANAIIISIEYNSPFYYILTLMQRIFHSILTSHLVLNVRKAAVGRDPKFEFVVASGISSSRVKYLETSSSSTKVSPFEHNDDFELRLR
ncbi:hypothetical protein SCHPADRAFT_885781 [Schizopora paradoxa]|uniref:DUF6533 domain-containing protein n=1 Tax=Schizopora paradoxa TaxID=27342 RepID=A0A0H2S4J8_9AGAM|nr:hypothetical protein SCHPADRAFT_885781 [Schizopora paradoxa]